MPIKKSLLFSAVLLGAWASPSRADYSWIIAGDYGQKPARVVVMIDLGNVKVDDIRGELGPGGQPYSPGPKKESINESIDAAESALAAVLGNRTGPFMSIPMMVVYESADQADFSSFTVRNFCDRKINVQTRFVFLQSIQLAQLGNILKNIFILIGIYKIGYYIFLTVAWHDLATWHWEPKKQSALLGYKRISNNYGKRRYGRK